MENPDSENVEVKIERRTRSAVNNIRKVEIMEKPNASESPVKIEPTVNIKLENHSSVSFNFS